MEDLPSDAGDLFFGLLGPLQVHIGRRAMQVGSPKHRVLLASLLLRPRRVVPVRELADAMWAMDEPVNPRRTVQLAVVRLRATLAAAGSPDLLITQGNGYALDVPDDSVDLGKFNRRLREADAAAALSDVEAEAVALRAALACWRGEPLADIPSDLLQRQAAPRLREQRLQALERRLDLDLRLGRHTQVVAELLEATAADPLRERLWFQLVTALHRSGRRADALAAYHTGRAHLVEEFGIEPSDELRQLHAAVLGGLRSSTSGAVLLPTAPRQLPPDVSAFAGRTPQLAQLSDLLLERERTESAAAPIVVVSGTAGVGKTALAVHWSRRMADEFPDGQLWVNLRAYDHRPARPPEQALTLFLRALGVAGDSIPQDLDSQSGLYRSLMNGRRALVVIDNASTAEDVRPLLPGSVGNAVIVTSRDRLTGLVASDGAHPVELDMFTDAEGHELMVRRLGAQRVAAEPAAVAEIVERCARLPLALAIAAARAAQRPTMRLAALAEQLQAAQNRLDTLSTEDKATDARAIFCASYRSLDLAAARLFRLLGNYPGPDGSAEALGSLSGLSIAAVRPVLEELTSAHLVAEHRPGRYTLHDLLRTWATELALKGDRRERDSARRRVLDHYVHSAHEAALLIEPLRQPIPISQPDPAVTLRLPTDRDQALEWFATEYAGLSAAIEQSHAAGLDTHTWQLVWTLADFQQWRGLWHDRAANLHTALEAAHRLDHRAEQARAHRGLGYAYTRMARNDDAHTHLRLALDLYDELGDPVGQARAHHGLSYLLERQGNARAGLAHAEKALNLFPLDGSRAHRARALGTVGWCHGQLGDFQQSLVYNEQALALLNGTGDRVAEAATWDSLGYTHHHLGQHEQAIECYQIALRLRRDLGHCYGEANTLSHLGDTYLAVGKPEVARTVWKDALAIFVQLGEPDADHVRRRLTLIGTSGAEPHQMRSLVSSGPGKTTQTTEAVLAPAPRRRAQGHGRRRQDT